MMYTKNISGEADVVKYQSPMGMGYEFRMQKLSLMNSKKCINLLWVWDTRYTLCNPPKKPYQSPMGMGYYRTHLEVR